MHRLATTFAAVRPATPSTALARRALKTAETATSQHAARWIIGSIALRGGYLVALGDHVSVFAYALSAWVAWLWVSSSVNELKENEMNVLSPRSDGHFG